MRKTIKQPVNLFSKFEDEKFESLVDDVDGFKKETPSPKRQFDQFTATPKTVAKRAALIDFFNDLENKNILFLGDDDFTSLACASMQESGDITVLDIDRRILKTIKRLSDKNDFGISTIHYDARNTLPENFYGKFDVIFTDPPYTPKGVSLFLSRSIDALNKKYDSSRIYLCYGTSDKSKERFLHIYKVFVDSGMFIKWVFDKFNEYKGAKSIGNTSSLYILETTPKTKPQINGDFGGNIYTHN